jgi:IS30 family transposase
LEKSLYDAKVAHRSASEVLRNSRSGVNLTDEERLRLDRIVSPLIKQGQSPWHIASTQKDQLMLSDKTLYAYIQAGLFDATNTDLLQKVKMKPRKRKSQLKVEKGCRQGRTYREFLDWITLHPDTPVVQMDSVIGAKGGDQKVLLTIHFPAAQFMLAFLREANTARSVTEVFDWLKETLPLNGFKELFPVILTDNGPEFSHPSAIETDENGHLWTRIFYCDPNSPYQKGSIEAGHRLLRRVLPKGHSFNGLSQRDMNLLMSHVNSYARKSLGGRSPVNVFGEIYGYPLAKKLGIKEIPHQEINLTPSLLQ